MASLIAASLYLLLPLQLVVGCQGGSADLPGLTPADSRATTTAAERQAGRDLAGIDDQFQFQQGEVEASPDANFNPPPDPAPDPDPEPPAGGFRVKHRVAPNTYESLNLDPETGLDPNGNGVEFGLRIRFEYNSDYDWQIGPAQYWSWQFGDGEYGSGESVEYAYAEPGEYLVTLNAYDDAWAYDSYQVNVVVEPGMVRLGSAAGGTGDFVPLEGIVTDDEFWVASTSGELAHVSASAIVALEYPPLSIVGYNVVNAMAMAIARHEFDGEDQQFLLIARGFAGVDIWNTDLDAGPTRLANFLPPDPTSTTACAVAVLGQKVYVGMGPGAGLYEYEIEDLLIAPEEASPTVDWSPEGGVNAIASLGESIITGGSADSVTIYDFSGGVTPVVHRVSLPSGEAPITDLSVSGQLVGVRHGSLVSLIAAPSCSVLASVPAWGSSIALTSGRLLELRHTDAMITKWNTADPSDPYVMDHLAGWGNLYQNCPRLTEINGRPTLFVGERPSGGAAYSIGTRGVAGSP